MGVDVEELIIRPFRDVVDLGTTAMRNAAEAADEDPELSDRMTKAAKQLVREGERALKKLQPLWDGQVERYGDAFRDLMIQQEMIEKKRRALEDLLYDFDDYVELDSFDPNRYAELQAATKALALDAIDVAKRQNLDLPRPPELPAGGKFPPLPPLPLSARKDFRPVSRSSSRPQSRNASRATLEMVAQTHTPAPVAEEDADAGCWDAPVVRAERDDSLRSYRSPSRNGPPVNAPISPPITPALPHAEPRRPPSRADGHQPPPAYALKDVLPAKTYKGTMRIFPPPPRPQRPMAAKHTSKDTIATVATDYTSTESSTLSRLGSLTVDSSARSVGSFFDSIPSPTSSETHTTVVSHSGSLNSSPAVQTPDSPIMTEKILDMPPKDIPSQGVANRPPPPPPVTEISEGPMLVEELLLDGASKLESPVEMIKPQAPRQPECAIDATSTYVRHGGICSGAVTFRTDRHWQSIQPAVGYLAYKTSNIGRCSDCGYAHNMDEVKMDMDNLPKATFRMSGIGFRMRFLYKSHLNVGLTAKRDADGKYACLFCAQAGATPREGDPTVFRSLDDLVRHIARHPQPLIPVPGVVVRYGPLDKPGDAGPDGKPENHPLLQQHDYDVHLPGPPLPCPAPENVVRLATATATRDHFTRIGYKKLSRPPRYGGDMLEFMEGAVIVGITFPEKWDGKWCLGRHDGAFGAFPAKAVDLRPPQESEVPVGSGSGMSVKSRWKWNPPTTELGSPWLEFEKGEVISNVKCLYADYWCWSGTNSKGKHGVFPQSHIDLNSLHNQENLLLLGEKKSKKGFFTKANRRLSASGMSSLSGNT